MQYTTPQDVWKMSTAQMQKLQPGQWVYAGDKSSKGRFWGVKKSGTIVVAWYMNAVNSGDYNGYQKTLKEFAKS